MILEFGFFNELEKEEIERALVLKEKFGADYYRFIPKNGALKTDVKKFHERTNMLREKLDEYKKIEIYYDPVEENVAFTNYQTAKFFRGLGFEVLIVLKETELEDEKELVEDFEIIKIEDFKNV